MPSPSQTLAEGYAKGPDGRKQAREVAVAAVAAAVEVLPADELDAFRAEITELIAPSDDEKVQE